LPSRRHQLPTFPPPPPWPPRALNGPPPEPCAALQYARPTRPAAVPPGVSPPRCFCPPRRVCVLRQWQPRAPVVPLRAALPLRLSFPPLSVCVPPLPPLVPPLACGHSAPPAHGQLWRTLRWGSARGRFPTPPGPCCP